ncbi:hypothetical protein BDY24DRAFT_394674 [Mrakia frigida]|uniref:uncharacterized protein n=1 Tax=Mrakia frigida TaxID=29902 RepID=UPI003FCC12FE
MDPNKKYPHLLELGVRAGLFDPYIKAGRFKPEEPEEFAELFGPAKGWAAIGVFAGILPPVLNHEYRTRRAVKAGFPGLRPQMRWMFLAIPFSSFLTASVVHKVFGAYATNAWSKEHPEYTPEQVLDKVTLFYAVSDYSRDPNMARPPIRAEAGSNVLGRPSKDSERAANAAIASEFRNESPFKTGK